MESTADIQVGDVIAPRAAVSIEITSAPVLSYALAHNRVPVVSRLAVTNLGSPMRAATVRLGVRDAEGPIARTVELLADLDEGRTTVLTDLGLVMDPAAMLHVEEQRPGVVDVEVLADGEVVGEGSRVVQVLAAQQWLATPLPLALEMLAAHVMPHHPAITAMISEAAGVLEERTGRGTIQGYADGPERVDEIVAAVADVLQRRGIRYSEPPASWSDLGQQVRSPGDVLTWRVGTPLDTVVLMAAALERAGIRPLFWLAGGAGGREGEAHAFLGYWREERSAESAATTDATSLVNLVDLGLIGLVETTLLTSMGEPGADLHGPVVTGWLTGGLDHLLGVTDVHRARKDGIIPLPARARDEDGVLQVVEYRAALHSVQAPAEPAPPPPSSRPEAPARVQQWKNALLDLSLRNRLINYTQRSGLALTVPGSALGVLENFLHDGTPITLLPGDQLAAVQQERGIATARELPEEQLTELLVERRELHADVTRGGYLPTLRNLAYKAKTVLEETGANNLYPALGSLVWELDGRPLCSPLILIPVVLAPMGRTGAYRLSLDESGSSTPNYCLLEKLRQLHGLTVPTLTEAADGALDLDAAFEAVRTALVGHGLRYRVAPTADLAILQFAKFRLWKDLDEHWADFAENPLVHHLVHQPTEAFEDPARDLGGYVDLDELAAELLRSVRVELALLPDIADLTRPSLRHPWAFVDSPDIDLRATRSASAAVDAAVREVSAIPELAGVLRRARTADELDALAHVLGGPPIGLDVIDETFTDFWTAATSAVLGEIAAFTAFRHPGLDVCTPEVLRLPLAEVYVAGQTAAASSWWGRRGRLVAVRDQLAPYLRPEAKVRPKDVPAVVENLWRVQTAVQAIATRAASIPGLAVPEGWNPFVDTDLLAQRVQWLRVAGAAVEGSSLFHVQLRKLIVAGLPAGTAAADAVARLRDAVTALIAVSRSSSDQLATWAGDDGLVLRWSMTRPERGVDNLMSLRRWISFLDTLEPLRFAGLFDARALLVTGAVKADDAVRAFDRGLAAASVAERLDASGLDLFDAGAHEKAIRRFTRASRAVRDHLTSALPARVLAARPFDAASGSGQVGALQRELAKQRRGLGVRQLLAQYGELITQVMPCVLVSPDSVARFFPAVSGLFDLLVFDEASQIRVADAVGALGRANAAVVVGDSRQMPPTSFAEPSSVSDDAGDLAETAVEDEESILSECIQARVPRQWLSWHYRSQDESLIAFSNAQYYGNRLSSFPAPTHGRPSSEPDGRGVSLVRVPGTFHRSGAGRLLRTNPIEAKAIVAEIRRRFDLVPKYGEGSDVVPSIGVVTFNAQQRAYIESLLRDADDDRLAAALDRADGEGLFVKNLENVQGDERDVVFFSTGFSPDASGSLPLNFGPLNRVGGERRLNVAVTRARRQVVLFSSFDPEQLRAEETSSVGIKHLRAHLDMAAQGTDVLPRDARSAAGVDRHREEIAAALRDRGLVVRTDVGLSDFKVDLAVARSSDPESPLMAELAERPAWGRRGTRGSPDGPPVEVLGDMLRWPVVERVWLPSWLAARNAVLDGLVEAVKAVEAVPSAPPAEPIPLPTAAVEPFKGVAALRSAVTASVAVPAVTTPKATRPAARRPSGPAAVDGETPFVPWLPKPAGEKALLDELPASKAARVVRRVLNAGIKAEGPIHVDRLAKLTVNAFGLNRASEGRKKMLLSLLPPSAVVGDYLWPEGVSGESFDGFRRQASSTDRPLEHVAPEEIGNAMAALCRAGAGMMADELFTQTAAVFGHKRRTAAVTPVLEAALKQALHRGRLVEQPSGLLTV